MPSERDAEVARFLKRAKVVLLPVWFVLAALAFVFFAAQSPYALVPFVTLVVLTIVWNVYFVLWKRRLEARSHSIGGTDDPVAMVRDQRTGQMRPRDHGGRDRVAHRLVRGARVMLVSTPFVAEAAVPLQEVQQLIADAAQREGATYSWRQTPTGTLITLAVRPPNIRNRIFMRLTGELREEGTTTFRGSIRPDAMMLLLGMGPALVFLVAGIGLLLAAIGLMIASPNKGSLVFMILWGLFACTFSLTWLWSHNSAFEKHVRMLRSVFGDGLRLGNRAAPQR